MPINQIASNTANLVDLNKDYGSHALGKMGLREVRQQQGDVAQYTSSSKPSAIGTFFAKVADLFRSSEDRAVRSYNRSHQEFSRGVDNLFGNLHSKGSKMSADTLMTDMIKLREKGSGMEVRSGHNYREALLARAEVNVGKMSKEQVFELEKQLATVDATKLPGQSESIQQNVKTIGADLGEELADVIGDRMTEKATEAAVDLQLLKMVVSERANELRGNTEAISGGMDSALHALEDLGAVCTANPGAKSEDNVEVRDASSKASKAVGDLILSAREKLPDSSIGGKHSKDNPEYRDFLKSEWREKLSVYSKEELGKMSKDMRQLDFASLNKGPLAENLRASLDKDNIRDIPVKDRTPQQKDQMRQIDSFVREHVESQRLPVELDTLREVLDQMTLEPKATGFGEHNREGDLSVLGSGANNTVYSAQYKLDDGRTVDRVIKPLAHTMSEDSAVDPLVATGIDPSNPRIYDRCKASEIVDRSLGYNLLPSYDLGVEKDKVALVMSRAEGRSPLSSPKGDISIEGADAASLKKAMPSERQRDHAQATLKLVDSMRKEGLDDEQIQGKLDLLSKATFGDFGRYFLNYDDSGKNILCFREYQRAVDVNFDSPGLRRDMMRMQLMDHVNGQVDRHGQNYFVRFDKDGGYQGLTGIDDDASHGSKYTTSEGIAGNIKAGIQTLKLPPVVDSEMRTEVGEMHAELQREDSELLTQLREHLTEPEISAMKSRVAELNAHINNPEKCTVIEPGDWGVREPEGRLTAENFYAERDRASVDMFKQSGQILAFNTDRPEFNFRDPKTVVSEAE